MELTRVITGTVMTEKSERLKSQKVYTLTINPKATKVDVKQALRRYYGVEPEAVRIVKVQPKKRLVARGKFLQKRDPVKRALVTLSAKSKALDLTSLQS